MLICMQLDRNDDMLRSCLRAVEAVARIPNVETCVPFKVFMNNTVLSSNLSSKYAAIKQERAEADGVDSSTAKW